MNELLAAEADTSWESIAPHLDAALGELAEADRDAVLLRYFERKTAPQMAKLDIPPAAARGNVCSRSSTMSNSGPSSARISCSCTTGGPGSIFSLALPARLSHQLPLRVTRFIADSHLGGLARLLRMAGFDTRYENGWSDEEIRRRAGEEGRIILTRDRALLMCRTVTHACYVHALEPHAQFREIVERLQLGSRARPFTLCLHRNLPLAAVERSARVDQLRKFARVMWS